MELFELLAARHSVRSYTDQKIEGDVLATLQQTLRECSEESGLRFELCLDEPRAFSGLLARYGKFENVRNYVAVVGRKNDPDRDEKCGYYGEKIVLKAAELMLNTCFVAVSYSKRKCSVALGAGEKLLMTIPIGYGQTQGVAHKSRPLTELGQVDGAPDWFVRGVKAAQLAPTAMNAQKFFFERQGNTVKAMAGRGSYTKVDLGIVKLHFELGAEGGDWTWAD